jgi:carboxypeptidase Q
MIIIEYLNTCLNLGFENLKRIIKTMTDLQKLLGPTIADPSVYESTLYYSLETLCICFPARLSGSTSLEQALDYLFNDALKYLPAESCKQETAEGILHWVRNKNESVSKEVLEIEIIPGTDIWPTPYPVKRTYRILANGLSVGTPPEGSMGEIKVIYNWDELEMAGKAGELVDKLVLFNYGNFTSYGEVGAYRRDGSAKAAQYGAKGVLIRSLTPNDSVSGVHTGTQEPGGPIPAACLSIEDAEVLTRLIHRGHQIIGHLSLPCELVSISATSRNLIFEIKGSEFPNEIVIIGGHTDSWDCHYNGCQGAHDDGQGVIIALEIIKYLYQQNQKPRRTIRAILFVDEEISQAGANSYQQLHQYEAENVQIAIETDVGVGPVCGFGFTGTKSARIVLQELLTPLTTILQIPLEIRESWSGNGVDISPMIEIDHIPGMLLRHEDTWWTETYFHFHHTNADTIDHVDKSKLLQNFQVLLGTVWILANCDERIPHH